MIAFTGACVKTIKWLDDSPTYVLFSTWKIGQKQLQILGIFSVVFLLQWAFTEMLLNSWEDKI